MVNKLEWIPMPESGQRVDLKLKTCADREKDFILKNVLYEIVEGRDDCWIELRTDLVPFITHWKPSEPQKGEG